MTEVFIATEVNGVTVYTSRKIVVPKFAIGSVVEFEISGNKCLGKVRGYTASMHPNPGLGFIESVEYTIRDSTLIDYILNETQLEAGE